MLNKIIIIIINQLNINGQYRYHYFFNNDSNKCTLLKSIERREEHFSMPDELPKLTTSINFLNSGLATIFLNTSKKKIDDERVLITLYIEKTGKVGCINIIIRAGIEKKFDTLFWKEKISNLLLNLDFQPAITRGFPISYYWPLWINWNKKEKTEVCFENIRLYY